jgi:hypothetical protein
MHNWGLDMFLNKYCSGKEVTDTETGEACGTNAEEEEEEYIRTFLVKTEKETGRLRRMLEYNIKIDVVRNRMEGCGPD